MINKKILADGIITKSNKVSLGILTADCAPIFFIDIKKEIICAIHAGWKGAKNNIIKNGVKLMLEYGSKLNNIISCIGPCIGKDSYLVKVDFFKQRSYFVQNTNFGGSRWAPCVLWAPTAPPG